jgi:exopolysaccharide biosynthesis polyprenyl glycosylphosphotransferase
VKGFLDQNHSAEPRLLGRIEDLASLARAHFVDEIFVTIPSAREVVRAVALEARRNHLDVKVVPELYDGLGWRAPLEYVGDFPVLSLHREPIPVLGLLAKRAMDILVSAVGLIVLSPLLAAIAIAIKLDSPGPAFYLSTRVGKKGRKFTCYKLRSMVVNADALKDGLRNLNQRCGPTFKISHDPRITRLGCFLRQTSLDELPQLGNVLKGDMSLVGPRPPSTDDFDQYSLEHLRRLDVTPGITGLWQISARRDPSFERNMALDIEYIENWNLWLDLKILMKTIPTVVAGNGE